MVSLASHVRGSGGQASVMGIGTAVPTHVLQQSSFAGYYFEISNSAHMVDLQAKFEKICEKSSIERRHFHMSDEFLRSNPSITAHQSPSLDLRQKLASDTVPRLGAEAAVGAIADWGRQASEITHLVFCTTSSGCMPGFDLKLVNLLGLPVSTKRYMLYQTGCQGGGASLRLAKDLAENSAGARVLVVCSEVITMGFRGPSASDMGNLVGQALFGEAAAALIVGDGPLAGVERPLFEVVTASQHIIPGTEEVVVANIREVGITYTLHPDVPVHISSNVEELVKKALLDGGIVVEEWNDLFWLVHPGGRAILDGVETVLGLNKDKLDASREVMRQNGNTMSSCVILAMDEMRRRSKERQLPTAGEGLEWGLLVAFGPGLSVETILLRAPPTLHAA
uniref:Uncharacterized protein n=1 Tax=Avena sativa TaxID=4498 RepID=A0ACD5XXE2_AVESA